MYICVFGAASMDIDEKYLTPVEELCFKLAQNGHNLVFGSGSTGEMGAAARGFKRGGGKTHGVIPKFFNETHVEFVDYSCDEMTYTESMRERKAVMEEVAEAFVISPGGMGTFEEFFEVLTLKQLGRHRKPIAIFNIDGYYDKMIELLDYAIDKKFIKENCRNMYEVFDENSDFSEIIDYLENDDMGNLTIEDFK